MAQLVAHLLCKQGVTGSSPVSSTISDVLEPLTLEDAGVGARAANGSAIRIVAFRLRIGRWRACEPAVVSRRIAEMRSGAVEMIDADELFAEMRASVAE